jgi:hypothetical protein
MYKSSLSAVFFRLKALVAAAGNANIQINSLNKI